MAPTDDRASCIALEDVAGTETILGDAGGRYGEPQGPARQNRAEIPARPERPPSRVKRTAYLAEFARDARLPSSHTTLKS